MINLIVPFIFREDLTKRTLEVAYNGIACDDTKIIAFDNGCDKQLEIVENPVSLNSAKPFLDRFAFYREPVNRGMRNVFKRGFEISYGNNPDDIICFIHNDVLIWENGWDARIQRCFTEDPNLGLAGFAGGKGVALDGGRIDMMTNMLGHEWGSPGSHHGRIMNGFEYGSVLDGLAMIFRRRTLDKLINETDAFDDRRPPNHWYDRHIPLQVISQQENVGIIGIEFDHYSANTPIQTASYRDATAEWAQRNSVPSVDNMDHQGYEVGREQFEKEWGARLPLIWHKTDPVVPTGFYVWSNEHSPKS